MTLSALTDDERAFYRAIATDPASDAPRLIYADWLDEQSDDARERRAEFIRIQCELARDRTQHPLLDLRRARAQFLERWFSQQWTTPFEHIVDASKCTFERGILTGIALSASDYLRYTAEIFELLPVRQLTLLRLSSVGVSALCASPYTARLQSLVLDGNQLDDTAVRTLALSGYLRVSELSLADNRLTDPDAFADVSAFRRLQVLRLQGNAFSEQARRRLISHLRHVPYLSL